MKRRIYVVTDTHAKTATLVRAGTPAQAIGHVVRGIFKATPATAEAVAEYVRQTGGAVIEDAGETE